VAGGTYTANFKLSSASLQPASDLFSCLAKFEVTPAVHTLPSVLCLKELANLKLSTYTESLQLATFLRYTSLRGST